MKLKTGDNVIVIAGKDKGKKGKIVKVLRDENRVVVEGVNMRKKHQRARRAGQKGQIVEFPASLNASNVMLEDPKNNKPTRVRMEVKEGKKTRVAQKSGAQI